MNKFSIMAGFITSFLFLLYDRYFPAIPVLYLLTSLSCFWSVYTHEGEAQTIKVQHKLESNQILS